MPSAVASVFVIKSHACIQDELALTRQHLHHVQQQLLEEAAKQEPKVMLMKVYEASIRNLTAREGRLMDEARAMRLEAQATGEQSFHSACLAVAENRQC